MCVGGGWGGGGGIKSKAKIENFEDKNCLSVSHHFSNGSFLRKLGTESSATAVLLSSAGRVRSTIAGLLCFFL